MTTEHFLQHCPLPDGLRDNTWPENRPLREKLYGDLVQLKRTGIHESHWGGCLKEAINEEEEKVSFCYFQRLNKNNFKKIKKERKKNTRKNKQIKKHKALLD